MLAVHVLSSPGPESRFAAVIVVRTPVAAGSGAHDQNAAHAPEPPTQTRLDDAAGAARDLELGRRMQEERALAKRVREVRAH